MRKLFWITLLGAALTNLGCVVPSLHPLFTENDLVFDARMIGPWIDDDEDFWVFEKSSKGSYRLTLVDEDEMSLFDAHLLELGPHRFLDLYPRTGSLDDSFRGLHLLPVHTFYKVAFEGGSLKLIALDIDWLEEEIETGRIEVAHAWPEGDLLLTASTEELQELVVMLVNDSEAFSEDDDSFVIELDRTVL